MLARDRAEPVRGFLGLEPERPPGSVFTYNNGATYVLGAVLQRVTGKSLTGYLQPRLFDPLVITPPYWDQLGGPRLLTGDTEAMQSLLDAVWSRLLPALAGPGTIEQDEQLANRLATLAIPVDGRGAHPADAWVTARSVTDGQSLTLEAGGHTLVVDCGTDEWARTTVTVGSGRHLVGATRGG